MNNAIGLGIILSLRDRASSGLDKVRNKLTALRDVSDSMMKRFDEGAKQMVAGFASMAAGAKVIGVMNKMFGDSVNTAADFEQAMARVGAVSGAVGKDFEALTKQARDLGRDTQYSATQVANSQELLARAGFQTNDIITVMPNLLYMAGAEGMDLASAVDIASNTLRGFALEASDMERLSNVLAQTSRMTNTSISTLGESFKKLAPYAKAVDIPLEKAAAMIGVIGDVGIKGEASGTAVAFAIRRLATAPKAVEETLESLGIAAKDDKGNFVQFDTLMERIYGKINGMGNLDQMNILSRIFGGTSGSSMLALMNATVSGKLKEKTDKLDNIGNVAKEMYDIMNATAQGAMKRLESASEGMRIAIGNHLLPVYTKAIDLMTQFKSWLTQLIEEHPIISKAVIGFTAALLGLSGTALILVGALASVGGMIKMWPLLRKMAVYALASIKAQARMAFASLSGLSVPVIGMIALAGALYYAWRKNLWGIRDMVTAVTEGFRMAWIASTDGIAEIDDALANKLKAAGILDYAIIVGQVFFRIRKFISGFIEGLKDSYNFVMGIFDWLKGIFSPVIESGQELLKFLGILKPVTETSTDTWRAWGQLLGRIAPAVIGVITAFKGIRIITGIFGDLGKAILGMLKLITAHPIIALLTVIAMLAVYAYNHWDEITAYVSEKWQKITGLCTKSVDWVKRKWQALKNWWNSWTLKDIFAPVIDWAVSAWNFVKRKWNEFRKWWDSWTLKDLFAPVLNFASDVKAKVLEKWEELKTWWASWTLPDVFAVLGEYVDNIIITVKGKWLEFTNWLSSLNPFKSWGSAPAEVYEKQRRDMQNSDWGRRAQTMSENYAKQYGVSLPKKHAKGGIINSPTLSWVGEAGREAIIPLEDRARGLSLWLEAGRELGTFPVNTITNQREISDSLIHDSAERSITRSMAVNSVIHEISDRIIPHATGGIFSQPHIGLIAEAGREAVIPLDDKARGIPLLMAAANEIGGMDFITNQPYSMPMLIQQTQNQTAERQPETRGEIAVNVDVKPSDVYIDGERIGRISFRWSERQTIRSGIDS